MADSGKRLIFFHGRECPHCRKFRPLVEETEKEIGKPITQLEVWHNEDNANLMRKYGEVLMKACGGSLGVPALYNEKTGKALCGMNTTKEQIIKWANE